MGITNFLPHLPGGRPDSFHHSFLALGWAGKRVPVNGAGILWQCAADNAADYLRDNYLPALSQLAKLLSYLRSVCKWQMVIFLDGQENPAKAPARN